MTETRFPNGISGGKSTDLDIWSDTDIALYPQGNIWISQGTKLIFEGTTPDDWEVKLQATTVTADRDIILPDANGTVAVSVSDTTTTTQGELNLDFTLSAAGNISAIGTAYGISSASSPTFAGLTIDGSSIVFEGSSADANETTLTVTNPTADNTITLPNASGTVAVSVSDTTTTTQGALSLDFTLSAAGNISATGTAYGIGSSGTPTFASVTFPGPTTQTTAFQDVAAHVFYVHPNPGNTYTATGTINSPFNTIAAAIAAAVADSHNDSNPATIILLANITENVTLQPGIYLTSLGTGTHGSPSITGTVTVTSSTGTISDNHYSISNLRIVAPVDGKCINFTGTAPQRLFVRDMWLDANGTGSGIYTDNTGASSTLQFDIGHLTHSGTGDVYCVNVTKGNCYITDIETSGAVQVGAVQTGAVLTIDGSELDAVGDVVLESYGTGSLTVTNSLITNTATNSNGIKVNGSNATTVIGNCVFTIPVGTGKVVNNVTSSATNVLAYAGIITSTGYNSTVDTTFTSVPLTNAVGTIVKSTWNGTAIGAAYGGTGLTSLGTGVATWLGTPSSANLLAAITDETGTGALLFGTSPSITTSITTPSTTFALVNATATTVNFAGAATTALNIGASNAPITGFAAPSTTSSTASSLGYLGVPASTVTTTNTLTIADAGEHVYVTTAGQTITIPDNASVAFPIGTTIGFIAGPSATTVTIAITSDTMYLGGLGTTGSRTLAAYGMATAIKVAATTWFISGNGLT
jgi:hypothetical protein